MDPKAVCGLNIGRFEQLEPTSWQVFGKERKDICVLRNRIVPLVVFGGVF